MDKGQVLGVISVVVLVVLLPIQIGTRIDQVYISDIAIQGQRRLIPIICARGGPDPARLQIAKELGVVVEVAFMICLLGGDTRCD